MKNELTLLLIFLLIILFLYCINTMYNQNDIITNVTDAPTNVVLPINNTFLDRWSFWNNRYPVDWGVPNQWNCPGGRG